jgi:hypothetical protein
MGLNNQIFNTWSGGINRYVSEDALQDGEFPEMANMRVLNPGSIEMRRGVFRFDTAGMPTGGFEAWNLFSWNPYVAGVRKHYIFMSINGNTYRVSQTGVVTDLLGGSSGGHDWCFESGLSAGSDFLYMVNGDNSPRKYNPSTDVLGGWSTAPPTLCSIIKSWRNFMVATGDSSNRERVYFSALNNPDSWTPGTDFIDIGSSDDDADPITWMDTLGDDLIIFKEQSVWRMTAGPPTPVVKRIANVGCYDRFQSAELLGRLYFWTGAAVYSLDARTDETIVPTRRESQKVDLLWQDLSDLDKRKAKLCVGVENHLYVRAMNNDFGVYNLFEFAPELGTPNRLGETAGAWFKHTIDPRAMCVAQTTSLGKCMVGDFGGKLGGFWLGWDDLGQTIQGSLVLPPWEFSPLEFKERLRRLNVLMEGNCTIDLYSDHEQSWPFDQATQDFEGTLGTEGLGHIHMLRLRPELRARAIQAVFYCFSNYQNTKGFVLHSIEAAVRGRKEH